MKRLSKNLKQIYSYEIEHGNQVDYVAEPAGTKCPLAVIFKKRLMILADKNNTIISDDIEYWECRDPHYPIEAGYFCKETRHSIAGPLF